MFRPHDLLRLSAPSTLSLDAPGWVTTALGTTPWVVVRRASLPADRIAVGVRGTTRSQRHATDVGPNDICTVRTPEDLAYTPVLRELPALSTLQTARPMLEATGLPWGPTGSVGFELATGVPAASPDSDLDLVIRMPDGTAGLLPLLVALHRELSGVGVRVDCQVESPIGAVALAELAGGRPDVLVRTAEGPRLVPRAIAVP